MRRFRVPFALFLGVLMLVVAACGGKKADAPASSKKSTPNPIETKAAVAPREIKTVSIAVGGKASIIYLPPAIAEYNNFFKDEGIVANIKDLAGGAQAAQALVSGEVDFASMAVEHAVKSKAQGVDLVMLALYTRYPAITLVVDSKLKDKVKTPADLKGMKVGVTSPGSATHKAMLSLMDKFGLNPADIEIIGVGTSGMPEAIKTGKVQAAFGLDPWVSAVINGGHANILWDLRTKKDTEALYGGDYPFVGLMTRREVLDKDPELAARVVRAVVRSNQLITKTDSAQIAALLPTEIKGQDVDLYVSSLRANIEAFSPDGLASELGLQLVIDSLKRDKVIPDTMTIRPSMIFDGTFAR